MSFNKASMEKKESKERANLKISFIDLFPSYDEIDENKEGINLSFQNLDLTYNLTELIKNREEIFVPHQIPNHTIKIFLLKSSNLYATGPFTIKSGEQWVTFSYDHKKKQSSNLALSLINCIKIKFLCKMDIVPALNNQQKANTEIQTTKNESILANILSKPSPKKLYSNFSSKKKNNNSQNNNVNNNTTLSSSKNTNNPLLRSENLSEFYPLASSSGVMGKDYLINEKNKSKNIKKVYNNNLNNSNSLSIENKKICDVTSGNQKKKNINKNNDNLNKEKKKNNKSLNNIANTIDNKNINENNKSKQILKRNKSKSLIDNNTYSNNNNKDNNKNKTNKKEKQTISATGNINNNINYINEQNSKKTAKNLSYKNLNLKKDEKENNELKENNNIIIGNIIINNNNEIENSINENKVEKINKNQIENDNHENNELNNYPLLDENNDYENEVDILGLDNFSKKLEDFQLLYSDDYIKSIKDEDYSLEIELYIEKLIELITEYHIQIEEKDLEYQLIKNMYNKNIHQYLTIKKLYKKLKLIKDDIELKKNNPKPINEEHDKNQVNNLITNKVEIKMFKFLVYSHKEKEKKGNKEQIKIILKNILNKSKNKNLINQNEIIKNWVKINMQNLDQEIEKGKKKGKLQKMQYDNKDKIKNDKKKKNVSNSQSKSKNIFNKNLPEEKDKKIKK